jgi:hypothetical protein
LVLLSVLALSLQATEPDWRPFTAGAFGFGFSTIRFDASRLERRGQAVRVWTRHAFHYSGRTPSAHEIRYEVDCGRRTARVLATADYHNEFRRADARPTRRRLARPAEPVQGDDRLAPLAARLCLGSAPAPASALAWLNIPDGEGPGARFSYEDPPRRDGPKLWVWVRYNIIDPERLQALRGDAGLAARQVDDRIELDCVARTARALERIGDGSPGAPDHAQTPEASPAPILPNTREAVLMRLLCPGGPTPIPASATGEE